MGRLSPVNVKQAGSLPETIDSLSDRCDACPAQAQVHLIHPPDLELAFCQHHFDQHEAALKVGGWQQSG